jgi:hypothetical protein
MLDCAKLQAYSQQACNLQAPTNAPPYDHTEAASNSTLAPELANCTTLQLCNSAGASTYQAALENQSQ